MPDADPPPGDAISIACAELARQVLWRGGAASSDVVETLASAYYEVAQTYRGMFGSVPERNDDAVIERAVQYLAHVHATPLSVTDVQWFDTALGVLLELAAPNTLLDEAAAELLPDLQRGIAESLAQTLVPREQLRVSAADAASIKAFEQAGAEHGPVARLLDLTERMFHGEPLDAPDMGLLRAASIAAALVRQARAGAGQDGNAG